MEHNSQSCFYLGSFPLNQTPQVRFYKVFNLSLGNYGLCLASTRAPSYHLDDGFDVIESPFTDFYFCFL